MPACSSDIGNGTSFRRVVCCVDERLHSAIHLLASVDTFLHVGHVPRGVWPHKRVGSGGRWRIPTFDQLCLIYKIVFLDFVDSILRVSSTNNVSI